MGARNEDVGEMGVRNIDVRPKRRRPYDDFSPQPRNPANTKQSTRINDSAGEMGTRKRVLKD